jgi:hypothetical protein
MDGAENYGDEGNYSLSEYGMPFVLLLLPIYFVSASSGSWWELRV